MTLNRILTISLIAALAAVVLPTSTVVAEEGYGSISGKIVLTGDVPKPIYLIKSGDLVGGGKPKNPEVCAAMDLKSDELVVDPKGKGIGNIFVYLRKAPKKIHPSLKNPPKTKLKFDQKHCRFFPHLMVVRTGQTVLVLSDDNCSHNTHTYPFKNEQQNFILPPNSRKGVPIVHEAPETFPTKVNCDIHPFMVAYWLIVDHPYAAATVATKGLEKGAPEIGTFKIDKIPNGTYEFRVWHEKAGYLNLGSKRGFKIVVNGDMTKTFEVPADTFTN